MDDLELLRTFVRVVETGSLTAVARESNASLSTISRQISQLEDNFEVRLLNRTTRQLGLTEDGQDLLDHARTVLEMVEGMKAFVGRHKLSPTGHVRVGVPVSLGLPLMDRLALLIARYPGLSVELVMQEDTGDMFEKRLDLAVRTVDVADPALIRRVLGNVVRMAVAAPAYLARRGLPRHHHDLTDHDCIVHRIAADSSKWRLTGAEGPVSIGVRGAVSSNNPHAVREAALRGLGIALLPEYLVANEIQCGTLRRVLPDYAFNDLPVFVVFMSRRYLAPRTRIVLDFLIEELHWLRRRGSNFDPSAAPPDVRPPGDVADRRRNGIVATAA